MNCLGEPTTEEKMEYKCLQYIRVLCEFIDYCRNHSTVYQQSIISGERKRACQSREKKCI